MFVFRPLVLKRNRWTYVLLISGGNKGKHVVETSLHRGLHFSAHGWQQQVWISLYCYWVGSFDFHFLGNSQGVP